MAEHRFRKAGVVSLNLTFGFFRYIPTSRAFAIAKPIFHSAPPQM